MTVLEAMNLLGLPQRPDDRAALKLAMLRALEQTPRQHELLEAAERCLSTDLEARESLESRQTSIERHLTREILLFDENRDAVMFGDEAPQLPVTFQAPPIDDAHWMGDDSVIFEGETAMMTSEFPSAAIPETASAAMSEIPDSAAVQIEDALPPQAETVSGEWQLMLESLEAEGLIKPEEGFSDALPAQMLALSDTHPERLADNPVLFQLALLEPVLLEPNSPVPEARAPEQPLQGAALLETPLFATPLFAPPLLADAQPAASSQYALGLEIPLFAPSPMDTSEQVKTITFDESLLISHGGSLTADADTKSLQVTPIKDTSVQVTPTKTLETLPNRKAPVATQLSIKPAVVQLSEPIKRQVTGRAGVTADIEVMRADRRSAAKPVVPRTYRDVREPVTQVRRRRQPVAVWLLSVAALLGSAVFIAPNLAAQLRDSLLPRAAALTKPNTGAAAVVVKPQVKIVKPALIRPASSSPSSTKTVKPTAVQPAKQIKPSSNPPAARKPIVSPTPRAAAVVNPPVPVVAVAPRAAVVRTVPKTVPRVSVTPSSAASLPPVTRPEGFASSGVGKSASKPVASTKPSVAPVKPVAKPAPPPAPVASIEYQDKPTPAQQLPGGLSRQEFGRQFLNRKQFEVWQAQQQELRFGSFAEVPLETQVLETEAFRAAVLIPTVRPTRPERP